MPPKPPKSQVTDDRGVTVTLPAVPTRIVSVLPSLTESVCELGLCARLVGVDRYSNFPVSVQKLPQVGGGIDPSIEAIVALKPDVVLMAKSSRGAERLEALGLKVVALEPKTHADVQRVMLKLGQLLGCRMLHASGARLMPVCRRQPSHCPPKYAARACTLR